EINNPLIVRKVTASTGIITTIAGNGSSGPGDSPGAPAPGDGGPATSAYLDNPEAVVVDGSGNVYILEDHLVRKVDPAGTITTFAGNGQPGYSGDGGPATQASLSGNMHGPGRALALDGKGNLFIADQGNNRIRKVDTNGVITTVAGNGTSGFSGDGGPATSATLNGPGGLAVDSAGNLYIGEFYNERIRKVDPTGAISTFAGTGVLGFSGDGGDALAAKLTFPTGIISTARDLFFCDTGNNRIRSIRTAPVINSVTASQSPVIVVNTAVTFTADAVSAYGDPLTYAWSLSDGQTGTGNPITLQIPTTGTFTGTLSVSDGYATATGSGTFTVAGPTTSTVAPNVDQGQPAIVNPLNKISIQLANSTGGLVELAVDIDALLNRNAYFASTDFSDLPGRAAVGVLGPQPVHQYEQTGVFVATSNAIEAASNLSQGKARKTLAIGNKETGQQPAVTGDPPSQKITPKSLTGKFIFKNPKPKPTPDQVAFSGTIRLAPGLDLSKAQEIALGIGNITDNTILNPKGVGTVPGTQGHLKQLRVKYPRLKSGTITAGGETAEVDITLNMVGMSPAGFDTEGVTAAATDLNAKGQAPRSIQVAVVLAGVSYELLASVTFQLSSNKGTGQLLPTRASK
ncbi:MAG: PKD domain-containing protein, partial [Planctomycetota bacterium]